MLTIVATYTHGEIKEDIEFGPFLYAEMKDGILNCETEDDQFVTFFLHENRWYPRASEAVLVGETLQYIDRGTPPSNTVWLTGGPDLTHAGWDELLIIEVADEEEESEDVSDEE